MFLFIFTVTIILSTWADEGFNCGNLNYFHQPIDSCPASDDPVRCKNIPQCNGLLCCDLNDDNFNSELQSANVGRIGNITGLHIRNATFDKLLLPSTYSRYLTSLSITDGNIGIIDENFGKLTSISSLNLSSNGIKEISNTSLTKLYKLRLLDLSHNNLSYVPHFTIQANVTIDVSDNKPLQCISLLETIKKHNITFNNTNKTLCLSSKIFHWFNSTEHLTLAQVERIEELRKNCTIKNCSCIPHRWDMVPGHPLTLSIKVDCAGKQLTSLPPSLPLNTIALNVSNNNISSLDPISSDPSYESLRELYADNNKIVSILPLEGSKFISNFAALSLRGNKLKSFPTYVLSDVLDRNDFRLISLGQNRLECDCNTAKVLKVWLLTKQKHITDCEEVFCDNMKLKVLALDPSKLCQSQQDWTDYIYYIITFEVLLLVFLIVKVSYDYWVFKTAGYLPWPASKMPKLPCDWLCE